MLLPAMFLLGLSLLLLTALFATELTMEGPHRAPDKSNLLNCLRVSDRGMNIYTVLDWGNSFSVVVW